MEELLVRMYRNATGQVVIRMGGIEARAYDIAQQDTWAYVLASGLSPKQLRAIADRVDEGAEEVETP